MILSTGGACVCVSVWQEGGVHGWGGMHGQGVCMAGEHA